MSAMIGPTTAWICGQTAFHSSCALPHTFCQMPPTRSTMAPTPLTDSPMLLNEPMALPIHCTTPPIAPPTASITGRTFSTAASTSGIAFCAMSMNPFTAPVSTGMSAAPMVSLRLPVAVSSLAIAPS